MRTLLCSCVAVLAVSGCVTDGPAVRIDQAADADLAKCRSFDWHAASGDAASLTEQRVRAAALQQLQEKGYALATEKPDCRITYVLTTQERPQQKPSIGVGAVGGSGGVGGGIGVSLPIGRKKQHAGTFTIDVIDVARNAQVWSGSLAAQLRSDELSEEEARAAVREVLAEFPDRATADR